MAVERLQVASLSDRNTGLYIHIPFCLSKCSYCDFFSIPSELRVPDSYVEALCNEITAKFCCAEGTELCNFGGCSVDSVYIGGGTPSLLSSLQIKKLFDCIKNNVPLMQGVEITIEVNPDDVTPELLSVLAENGVNRISCGIQSLNDECLSFCSRRANACVNEKALDLFREYWHGKLSLDVICAMPRETNETFLRGLKTIISYNPDHISMYSLTVEEETPLGKRMSENLFTYDYDVADEMWFSGRDFLEKAGYAQYEVSNFCRDGNVCRHNMKYWSRGDYVGCGCGATGTLYYSDGSAERTTNINDVKAYIDYWKKYASKKQEDAVVPFVIEQIDEKDGQFEFFMMALRKIAGFCEEDFESCFGKKLPQNFRALFSKWQEKELAETYIKENKTYYTLGRRGIIYLNSFLEELL